MIKQTKEPKLVLVTTPAYYTNSTPHVGHIYSNVLGNWFSKKLGTELLSGTDTHGKKVRQAAGNLAPEEFCRQVSLKFLRKLHLYTDGYRFKFTDSREHKARVHLLMKKLLSSGYVFKGEYSGYYDPSEESFFDSPGINREWLSETCLYLDLRKLRPMIRQWLDSNYLKVYPSFYLNKLPDLMQVDKLCLTRKESWGISLGNDWTIHVWVEALMYYLSDWNLKDELHLWQVLGKDILTFHAYYWPCLLLALGLKPKLTLLVTPWLTSEDHVKLSKSKGNFSDYSLLEERPEALRLYLLRLTLWRDNVYSVEQVRETWNMFGAKVGNLINRFQVLAKPFQLSMNLNDKLPQNKHVLPAHFLEVVLRESDRLNFLLNLTKPWSLSHKLREKVLLALLPLLHRITQDLLLVLPNLSASLTTTFLAKGKTLWFVPSNERVVLFPKWED